MKNPFKFGSVVESPYFTDREDELIKVQDILNSAYKRLLNNGFLIQENKSYKIEDPFFLRWLVKRRDS